MKNKTIIYFLIVLIVVAVLVFITINKKEKPVVSQTGAEQNMSNSQQIEGVKITILKEGTGNMVAKEGDTVTVNYTGKFTDGTEFDSNVNPKFNHAQPFGFILGSGAVIKGWDIGIEGMKVGEKRMLEINPDYAYGSQGRGIIPPNSTLIFEVELLQINK